MEHSLLIGDCDLPIALGGFGNTWRAWKCFDAKCEEKLPSLPDERAVG